MIADAEQSKPPPARIHRTTFSYHTITHPCPVRKRLKYAPY